MEWDPISIIKDWPTPESLGDVHVLLRFPIFYWRFIRKYAKGPTPI
jgi:hypothetical protein